MRVRASRQHYAPPQEDQGSGTYPVRSYRRPAYNTQRLDTSLRQREGVLERTMSGYREGGLGYAALKGILGTEEDPSLVRSALDLVSFAPWAISTALQYGQEGKSPLAGAAEGLYAAVQPGLRRMGYNVRDTYSKRRFLSDLADEAIQPYNSSFGARLAARTIGALGDVAIDPLSWVSLGSEGLARQAFQAVRRAPARAGFKAGGDLGKMAEIASAQLIKEGHDPVTHSAENVMKAWKTEGPVNFAPRTILADPRTKVPFTPSWAQYERTGIPNAIRAIESSKGVQLVVSGTKGAWKAANQPVKDEGLASLIYRGPLGAAYDTGEHLIPEGRFKAALSKIVDFTRPYQKRVKTNLQVSPGINAEIDLYPSKEWTDIEGLKSVPEDGTDFPPTIQRPPPPTEPSVDMPPVGPIHGSPATDVLPFPEGQAAPVSPIEAPPMAQVRLPGEPGPMPSGKVAPIIPGEGQGYLDRLPGEMPPPTPSPRQRPVPSSPPLRKPSGEVIPVKPPAEHPSAPIPATPRDKAFEAIDALPNLGPGTKARYKNRILREPDEQGVARWIQQAEDENTSAAFSKSRGKRQPAPEQHPTSDAVIPKVIKVRGGPRKNPLPPPAGDKAIPVDRSQWAHVADEIQQHAYDAHGHPDEFMQFGAGKPPDDAMSYVTDALATRRKIPMDSLFNRGEAGDNVRQYVYGKLNEAQRINPKTRLDEVNFGTPERPVYYGKKALDEAAIQSDYDAYLTAQHEREIAAAHPAPPEAPSVLSAEEQARGQGVIDEAAIQANPTKAAGPSVEDVVLQQKSKNLEGTLRTQEAADEELLRRMRPETRPEQADLWGSSEDDIPFSLGEKKASPKGIPEQVYLPLHEAVQSGIVDRRVEDLLGAFEREAPSVKGKFSVQVGTQPEYPPASAADYAAHGYDLAQGERQLKGRYEQAKRLITILDGQPETLGHETFHFAHRAGYFTKEDTALFEKVHAASGSPKNVVEWSADQFGQWFKGLPTDKGLIGTIRRVAIKLWRAIKALGGDGTAKIEQVFAKRLGGKPISIKYAETMAPGADYSIARKFLSPEQDAEFLEKLKDPKTQFIPADPTDGEGLHLIALLHDPDDGKLLLRAVLPILPEDITEMVPGPVHRVLENMITSLSTSAKIDPANKVMYDWYSAQRMVNIRKVFEMSKDAVGNKYLVHPDDVNLVYKITQRKPLKRDDFIKELVAGGETQAQAEARVDGIYRFEKEWVQKWFGKAKKGGAPAVEGNIPRLLEEEGLQYNFREIYYPLMEKRGMKGAEQEFEDTFLQSAHLPLKTDQNVRFTKTQKSPTLEAYEKYMSGDTGKFTAERNALVAYTTRAEAAMTAILNKRYVEMLIDEGQKDGRLIKLLPEVAKELNSKYKMTRREWSEGTQLYVRDLEKRGYLVDDRTAGIANFPQLRDYAVRLDTQAHLNHAFNRVVTNHTFWQLVTGITHAVKPLLTFWNIPFITRNLIGGTANNALLENVWSPARYAQAVTGLLAWDGTGEILSQARPGHLSAIRKNARQAARNTFFDIDGKSMSLEQVFNEMEHQGALERGMFRQDMGDTMREQVLAAGKPIYSYAGAKARMQSVASFSENMNRAVLYLDKRLKGYTPTEARLKVKEIHFDYDSLTRDERFLKNNIFWFWTWYKNSAPLQARNFFMQPGKFALLPKMQALLEPASDRKKREEIEMDWQRGNQTFTSFMFPPTKKGEMRTFSPSLPFEDPFQMFTFVKGVPLPVPNMMRIFGLTSPLFQQGLEHTFRRDFHTGRDWPSTTLERAGLAGEKVEPQWAYLPEPIRKALGITVRKDPDTGQTVVEMPPGYASLYKANLRPLKEMLYNFNPDIEWPEKVARNVFGLTGTPLDPERQKMYNKMDRLKKTEAALKRIQDLQGVPYRQRRKR